MRELDRHCHLLHHVGITGRAKAHRHSAHSTPEF
jgi:hypothetical protein